MLRTDLAAGYVKYTYQAGRKMGSASGEHDGRCSRSKGGIFFLERGRLWEVAKGSAGLTEPSRARKEAVVRGGTDAGDVRSLTVAARITARRLRHRRITQRWRCDAVLGQSAGRFRVAFHECRECVNATESARAEAGGSVQEKRLRAGV